MLLGLDDSAYTGTMRAEVGSAARPEAAALFMDFMIAVKLCNIIDAITRHLVPSLKPMHIVRPTNNNCQ